MISSLLIGISCDHRTFFSKGFLEFRVVPQTGEASLSAEIDVEDRTKLVPVGVYQTVQKANDVTDRILVFSGLQALSNLGGMARSAEHGEKSHHSFSLGVKHKAPPEYP
jgi:hypothetical protein